MTERTYCSACRAKLPTPVRSLESALGMKTYVQICPRCSAQHYSVDPGEPSSDD